MSFFKAQESRNIALNQMAIFTEIQLIEKAIATAAASGVLSATVGPDSSPPIVSGMTNSATHFYAWTDPVNYNSSTYQIAREQMDKVISNFQLLGYVVRRAIIASTTTFNWIVTW